jgi:[ribosomal protein S18]-alanine N-acetyltransferase
VNSYTLSPLTIAQIPEAVALDQLCLGGIWTEDGYLREVESPNSDLWVLTTPDQPGLFALGCLWSILEEAHITLLMVHPDHRSQGLGSQLLGALLHSARERGLSWATLEVGVTNTAAIGLYQKFGFQTIGTRKGYYQQTGEDALILWRKGLQAEDFQLIPG